MEINTIHILEYVSEKIPTDSDKIRQFIMHLHFLQYIFRRFAYQFFGILAVCIIQKDCRFLSSLTVLGKHSDLLLEGSLQFSASIRIYSSKGLTILGKMYIYM